MHSLSTARFDRGERHREDAALSLQDQPPPQGPSAATLAAGHTSGNTLTKNTGLVRRRAGPGAGLAAARRLSVPVRPQCLTPGRSSSSGARCDEPVGKRTQPTSVRPMPCCSAQLTRKLSILLNPRRTLSHTRPADTIFFGTNRLHTLRPPLV